ncbi:MAG: acetyltransferase [Phycisphaeraceae bacterium]|nr:acetyltransferase [Phycisphaeraceae bacterium]
MQPPASESIALIGGGGHALVVAEAAKRLGIAIGAVMDDRENAPAVSKLGLPCRGGLREMPPEGMKYFVCVGETALRARLVEALEKAGRKPFGAIVSPDAVVVSTARLGEGVFVGPRAVVNCFARIDSHAIVNTGAIIEHDCVVGSSAHVAPGSIVAGAAVIGERAFLGIGARVLPRVKIGAGSVVGAGAVVLRDIEPGARVAGVPARPI